MSHSYGTRPVKVAAAYTNKPSHCIQTPTCRSTRPPLVVVLLGIFNLALLLPTSLAAVSCNATFDCERSLRKGSTCDPIAGTCTNAFAEGCLRRMLGEDYPRRTCNSDDGDDQNDCAPSNEFEYEEIRIASQNWESAMFLSWILQILLTEFLGVPATIETSSDRSFSFYDRHNSFAYSPIATDFDALREAHRVGDCRKTERPCAHVIPEVWEGHEKDYSKAREEGYIEPTEGNGLVGKISWYLPKMTARRDPSLLSFFGLQGEVNRRKLSSTFKRPTTWLDFCHSVSANNCTADDGIAFRPPISEAEESSYFVEGFYTGHFRYTAENDCDKHPTECTGHIVNGPCIWSTFMEPQLYWNNISLESNGPMKPHGGYSYSQMIQVWKAANAMQSDVVMWWWHPDPTIEEFRGTPYAFVPITLPQPTQQCIDGRNSREERCSEDPVVRRGSKEGSCDDEAHPLQKIVSASLYERTFAVPRASRSPAYELLKSFTISDTQIAAILQKWIGSADSEIAADRYGHGARDVICAWVAENIEDLRQFIPVGYPRRIHKEGLNSGGIINAARVVAALSIFIVLCTGTATYHWRKERVMVFAKVHFLFLVLLGFLLVSLGAMVCVSEPSLASCIAQQWLITLGYTLGLVPLLVKVAAINKLMHEAARMRRVYLSPKEMFGTVMLVVLVVSVYLSVWTAVDPLTKQEERAIVEENSDVVAVSQTCASSSEAWVLAALGWEVVLLLCATVLAFQSRNVINEFNESRSLAMMIYTNFIFFVMRLTVYFLPNYLQAHTRAAATSFLLSLSTIFTLVIYFAPKLVAAAMKQSIASISQSRGLTMGPIAGRDPRLQPSNLCDICQRGITADQSLLGFHPACTSPHTISEASVDEDCSSNNKLTSQHNLNRSSVVQLTSPRNSNGSPTVAWSSECDLDRSYIVQQTSQQDLKGASNVRRSSECILCHSSFIQRSSSMPC